MRKKEGIIKYHWAGEAWLGVVPSRTNWSSFRINWAGEEKLVEAGIISWPEFRLLSSILLMPRFLLLQGIVSSCPALYGIKAKSDLRYWETQPSYHTSFESMFIFFLWKFKILFCYYTTNWLVACLGFGILYLREDNVWTSWWVKLAESGQSLHTN